MLIISYGEYNMVRRKSDRISQIPSLILLLVSMMVVIPVVLIIIYNIIIAFTQNPIIIVLIITITIGYIIREIRKKWRNRERVFI